MPTGTTRITYLLNLFGALGFFLNLAVFFLLGGAFSWAQSDFEGVFDGAGALVFCRGCTIASSSASDLSQSELKLTSATFRINLSPVCCSPWNKEGRS